MEESIWLKMFGEGEDLSPAQMAVRAFCTVIVLLVMLRLGDSMRIFGKKSTLDNIMVIMLGAVLARSIVGASPFWSATAAAATMIVLHKTMAFMALKNSRLNQLINGEKILLFRNGKFIEENIRKSVISKHEIKQSLRLETKKTDFEDIDSIYMETNGRLSFIEKEKKE